MKTKTHIVTSPDILTANTDKNTGEHFVLIYENNEWKTSWICEEGLEPLEDLEVVPFIPKLTNEELEELGKNWEKPLTIDELKYFQEYYISHSYEHLVYHTTEELDFDIMRDIEEIPELIDKADLFPWKFLAYSTAVIATGILAPISVSLVVVPILVIMAW